MLHNLITASAAWFLIMLIALILFNIKRNRDEDRDHS